MLCTWAQDASEFMSSKVQIFDDVEVNKDEVYRRLIEKCELDEMTKQILKMVFASFESKLRVLVQDQLKEGENAEDNMCLRETKSVPQMNADCERFWNRECMTSVRKQERVWMNSRNCS